jgi:CPA1 family monovalent cation:H+ antiporter
VEITLLLVGMAIAVLVSTAIADRLDIPAPLLLVVVGAIGAVIPQVPEVHLESEVVLFGLLPPLLYAAAQNTSLVDFTANRRPILLLSVGLVAFTAAGVAVVVKLLLPDLDWALAFAIGAVVAPPDAVAATAIGRRIGLPRRITTILEGESLLNDATALVALSTALAVATGNGFSPFDVGVDFVIAAGGGALVGFVLFVVVAKLRHYFVTDPVIDGAISLVVPFVAFVAAEEIHASGVIAVVVAGLLLGHKAQRIQSPQARIAERLNWRMIAYLLENTVFLLIGLQAWWIIEGAADSDVGGGRIVALCAATLATCIVLRLAWVFPARYLIVRPAPDAHGHRPPWTYTFLLGWAGMRGVVTLAAVFVIEPGTEYHEVLLLIALSVVAGTLFIQGMTLPLLARRLKVPGPDPAEDALARATLLQQASKAAMKELDKQEYEDRHGVIDLITQRLEQRNFAAWERLATVEGQESPSDQYNRIRQAMIQAERERVLEIRDAGSVPSEVVEDVLAMLDIEESMLDRAAEDRRDVQHAMSVRRTGDSCDDLLEHPAVETVENPVCQSCLDDGIDWVALRQCLVCGEVGCCDSSPKRHATAHFHETAHPVMESAEPGEDWRWCYVHHTTG